VTYVCRSTYNIGIKVEGNFTLYYLHLTPTTNIKQGDTVSAGRQIGALVYGTFTDACGWGQQTDSTYHLHFAFDRPASGYLEIGGCVLAISTGLFSCNGSNIGANGYLTNTGEAIVVATPNSTNDGGNLPSQQVAGGEHFWDGIVYGLVNLIKTIGESVLPVHVSHNLAEYVDRLYTTLINFAWLIAASQIIYIVPMVVMTGTILAMEVVRFVFIAYRWVVRLLPVP
jgi:hypothetical protein